MPRLKAIPLSASTTLYVREAPPVIGRARQPRIPGRMLRAVIALLVPRYGFSPAARDIVVYVVAVTLGFGQSATSEALKVARETVARSCENVEDRRDDASFDQEMTRLEAEVLKLKALRGIVRGT